MSSDDLRDAAASAFTLPVNEGRRRDGESTVDHALRLRAAIADRIVDLVRAQQAEAIRDTADWWADHPEDDAFETPRDTRNWLRGVAEEYSPDTDDE